MSSSNILSRRLSLAISPLTIDDLDKHHLAAITSGDLKQRIRWAKILLRHLEQTQMGNSIVDKTLVIWVEEALQYIQIGASSKPPVAEALFLRGDLAMGGTFPSIIALNKRQGFRDFEAAANGGYSNAWYRIGREYELFDDFERAIASYEKGKALRNPVSTYRLGLAHLLGQIGIPQDVPQGIEIIRESAMMAAQLGEPDCATPAFVWATMLCGEFEMGTIGANQLPSDRSEASKWMKKAAYLGHAGAQHRLGQAYEYAQLGEVFDPVMSLQYFSLASQQGDAESDLALSKWFLCGAEGFFDANEKLAWTFAEKAASKGLAAGQFALGYYNVFILFSWIFPALTSL